MSSEDFAKKILFFPLENYKTSFTCLWQCFSQILTTPLASKMHRTNQLFGSISIWSLTKTDLTTLSSCCQILFPLNHKIFLRNWPKHLFNISPNNETISWNRAHTTNITPVNIFCRNCHRIDKNIRRATEKLLLLPV